MSLGLVRGATDLLFCGVDWFSVERAQQQAVDAEIAAYDADKLLNTADDTLVDYFIQKYSLDVPVLDRDGIVADQREVDVDVSQDRLRYISDRSRPFHIKATRIEVEVPFSGDRNFFKIQPTTFSMSPPRGEVRAASLLLHVEGTDLAGERVRQEIDRTLAQIEGSLAHHRTAAATFNAGLASRASNLVLARKRKLLADRNLVASLGFPMKVRGGAAATYVSPQVRRRVEPVRPPPASSAPFKPEPALSDQQYDDILRILSNMVHVMERSPSAFAHTDEEAIRTHFLMQLNGHFEGQASGETFNYEGKTDIMIKDGGRNIFIAECKIWRGEKAFASTIDQLLGYLSWRDTKAAILVFNRNRDFSAVLARIPEVSKAHPNCKELVKQVSETSWQFRFAHRDDLAREMTITVLAFDVPRPS